MAFASLSQKPNTTVSAPISRRRFKRKKKNSAGCLVIVVLLGTGVLMAILLLVLFSSTHDSSATTDNEKNHLQTTANDDDFVQSSSSWTEMTSNSEYLMMLTDSGAIQIKQYHSTKTSTSSTTTKEPSFQRILRLLRQGTTFCQQCHFYAVSENQIYGTIRMEGEEEDEKLEVIADAQYLSLERGMVAWREEKAERSGSHSGHADFVIYVGNDSQPPENRQQQQSLPHSSVWGIVEDESSLEWIEQQIRTASKKSPPVDTTQFRKNPQGGATVRLIEPINFKLMII